MKRVLAGSLFILVALTTALFAQSRPTSVSPGEFDRFAVAAEGCPTFSWGVEPGAEGYEILLFEVEADVQELVSFADRQSDDLAPPKLRVRVPGTATSWTPNADACPQPGRYAWLVGATGDSETTWSSPRLFEIRDNAATELEATVERVLERLLEEGRMFEPQAFIVAESGSAKASSPPSNPSTSAPASATGDAAIRAEVAATAGEVYGVHGLTSSPDTGAAGVVGEASAPSGPAAGVRGISQSPDGAAGVFENPAGGMLLKGISGAGDVLSADGTGAITASAFILDCSSATTFYRDGDEDAFGDPNRSAQACSAPAGYITDGTDCDDDDAAVNPGVDELPGVACADGVDNDCDTLVDEFDGDCCGDALSTYYRDADNDLYGDPLASLTTCDAAAPSGYVPNDLDCDDTDAGINPDASESCNGVDDDCDGQIDEGNPDGGGACDGTDTDLCDEGTLTCTAGSLSCNDQSGDTPDLCDGVDNDCNPATADGSSDPKSGQACDGTDTDLCTEGTFSCVAGSLSCSDTTGDNQEGCNGLDDDCDGQTDEGNPGGGGSCTTGQPGICEAGTITCSGGALICQANSPPQMETCNGLDDDCDGQNDEGNPGGGGSCTTGQPGICEAGTQICINASFTCQANESPMGEICNGLDDDCDGQTDETFPTLGDSCDTGPCTGGTIVCSQDGTGTECSAPVCDDGNACTNDTCDPVSGCQYTDISASCNDSDDCTIDSCNPSIGCVSVSIVCDDSNVCTSDSCDPSLGCQYTDIVCDDSNACTSDTCSPTIGCQYTDISATCDDSDACTNDACNPTIGCVNVGIGCDDSDVCTTDSCLPASGCQNDPVDCSDGDVCTVDMCDPVTGCFPVPLVCDDGDACTSDSCNPVSGCVYVSISCDDGNDCTSDNCASAFGCINIQEPDGTPCTGGTCEGGVCQP